jgi:hypothetical protein
LKLLKNVLCRLRLRSGSHLLRGSHVHRHMPRWKRAPGKQSCRDTWHYSGCGLHEVKRVGGEQRWVSSVASNLSELGILKYRSTSHDEGLMLRRRTCLKSRPPSAANRRTPNMMATTTGRLTLPEAGSVAPLVIVAGERRREVGVDQRDCGMDEKVSLATRHSLVDIRIGSSSTLPTEVYCAT